MDGWFLIDYDCLMTVDGLIWFSPSFHLIISSPSSCSSSIIPLVTYRKEIALTPQPLARFPSPGCKLDVSWNCCDIGPYAIVTNSSSVHLPSWPLGPRVKPPKTTGRHPQRTRQKLQFLVSILQVQLHLKDNASLSLSLSLSFSLLCISCDASEMLPQIFITFWCLLPGIFPFSASVLCSGLDWWPIQDLED